MYGLLLVFYSNFFPITHHFFTLRYVGVRVIPRHLHTRQDCVKVR